MLLSRFGSMSPIGGVYSIAGTPSVTTNMINLLAPTVATSKVYYNAMAQDGTNIIACGTHETITAVTTPGLIVIDDNGDTVENRFYTRPNYSTNPGGLQQLILANNGYWYGFISGSQPYIIKFNNFGSIASVKRITISRSGGIGGISSGYHAAMDDSNNFYLAGQISSSSSNRVIILVKLDNNMNVLWQKQYDTGAVASDNDTVWMVKPDTAGNVYVVGRNNQSTSSSTLMKVNSSGVLQFAVGLDAPGTDTVTFNDVFIDGSDLYVGGAYSDSGVGYGLITKYNTSGVLQWQRRVSNTSIWEIKKSGTRYFYSGAAYYGPGLGEMDSSGNTLWQNQLLGFHSNLTTPVSLAVASSLVSVDDELNISTYGNFTTSSATTISSVLLKVPDDGTIPGTGAYGFFSNEIILTYKPLVFTNTNSSLTPINISYTQSTPIVTVYEDTIEWTVTSSLVTNYRKYI